MIDPYKIYERFGLSYVSKSGYNLLMHYLRDAMTPDLDMVQYMVEHGCNVNQVSVDGKWTPLFSAINKKAPPSVIRYLLEQQADANFKQTQNKSMIAEALSRQCNIDTIESLLQYSDLNQIKTSDGLSKYSFLCIVGEREKKIAAFIRAGLIFDFFEDENICGCKKIN
jgi:hypothetical protein